MIKASVSLIDSLVPRSAARALGRASIVTCALALVAGWSLSVFAQSPAPAATAGAKHRVVIAQFQGSAGTRVRSEVLERLAGYEDVEVVSLDDLEFAAKRGSGSPNTAEGRAKLSAELGIAAWLDGRADGTSAELTLKGPDGEPMAEVEVDADSAAQLPSQSSARMWAAMGGYLSPSETLRRRAEAEVLRAQKAAAAQAERERQQQAAEVERARAEREAAVQRAQARFAAELQRAKAKVAARAAEAERQKRLAQQGGQQRSAQLLAAAQQEIAPVVGKTRRGRGAHKRGAERAAASRWGGRGDKADKADKASSEPVTPTAAEGGVSPATLRWLQQQKEYRAPVASSSVPAAR